MLYRFTAFRIQMAQRRGESVAECLRYSGVQKSSKLIGADQTDLPWMRRPSPWRRCVLGFFDLRRRKWHTVASSHFSFSFSSPVIYSGGFHISSRARLFNKQFLLTTILCASMAFLKICTGVDTLFANQTIGNTQTLVSQSQVFEMGFFSPGKSPNRFLGIWYRSTPEVVVWVANRNNPITDSQDVVFSIARNGNLVISRNGNVIWSTNSSGVASNPALRLLNTGNLVLANETVQDSSGSYLWQSFDYPTDTYLPGMKMVDDVDTGVQRYLTSWKSSDDPSPGDFVLKIENQGMPELVVYRGKTKTSRTGKWNGVFFSGILPFPIRELDCHMVFNEDKKLVSVTKPFHSEIIFRITLDNSGLYHSSTMNARKKKWNGAFTSPRDSCGEYALCGPNGICNIDKPIRCECLKGFAPKFKQDWDQQDWSGGCTRITPLSCQNGDGFLAVKGVKYPDMVKLWYLNYSMGLDECRAECLRNCNCTAYANAYITNGGSGCVMWFEDLIDTREVSTADTNQNMYIRLPASELDDDGSPIYSSDVLKKDRPTKLILISIAFGFLISAIINTSVNVMRGRKKRAAERISDDLELPLFKFSTIVAATNNFSTENKIGEGGFGTVYKGCLSLEGEIAIKRLSRTSGQGVEEFKNEVILIAKLQHTNLVRLLGCCIKGEERMLIYEYMQNKSLDCFVFDLNRRILLTWPKRFDIIMGIARGLLYLHHDSRLKIIHRDLKPSNILLDVNLNPKISDFGIARSFEEDQPVARTRRVVGTYGYMAPEYAIAGKYSVKSDVFSLGVVLLEIVSGKKNRGFERSDGHFHSLLGQAWLLWKEKKTLELMDECLVDTLVESEVKRYIHVGLLCVQNFSEDRPEMSSVLFMLGNDEAILPEPKEPGFFIGRGSTPERSATLPSPMSDRNTITLTDLEAR